ncbi:bacterial proteasome activator family protein [Nocardioides jiangsuensis]|nr:bacterial proteasome activator family protein [Nocardioides jiangsuensis]
MTDQSPETNGNDDDPKVVIIGPDGMSVTGQPGSEGEDGERHITDLVEQPAKVMRIGSMIRQLLEEVKAAPLDEASRQRLKEIHESSIKELEQGLAPELVEELERLALPFTNETPSEAELRIAQAQLVGWLEGLFHGIQTAIYAQQVAARAQLEQMRRALPPGMIPEEAVQAAQQAAERAAETQAGRPDEHQGRGGGMYL